jgi:ribosomal protein L9
MRIVLLTDVEGVGVKGSEQTVAAGYMRNFLYPKSLATYGTPQNVEKFKVVFEVSSALLTIIKEALIKLSMIGNGKCQDGSEADRSEVCKETDREARGN